MSKAKRAKVKPRRKPVPKKTQAILIMHHVARGMK
jgi:hypothetical protein